MFNLDLHKILAGQQEIRRKPFVNATDKINEVNQKKIESISMQVESSTTSVLSVPQNMCPDGSDALIKNGQAVLCGSGVDGFSLCPKGYYCSIESEQNSNINFLVINFFYNLIGRLCCTLTIQNSNLLEQGTISSIAPYFGRRAFNPGEIIDRGSLPSDSKQTRSNMHASHDLIGFN